MTPPRVYHLASDLGPTAAGRQLALVARELARRGFGQAVGVLGTDAPFGPALAAAGVPVRRLPTRRPLDLLRAVAEFRPDVLLAWGPAAAQTVNLLRLPFVGPQPAPRLVVACADKPAVGLSGWLRNRTLRAADAVAALTPAEAERYKSLGVPADRIRLVPPAVAPAHVPDPAAVRVAFDLPGTARLVVAGGRFDRTADLRTAVWAFDVLKYTSPDLYLLLLGDGPERSRLARFADALGFDDNRVRFAGVRADTPGLLAAADVAWVTHRQGGLNLALEAMAAGVPVVAVRNADLAGIVPPELTVPTGDRVRLAAVTNDLLEQPDRRAAAAAAGMVVAGRLTPAAAADAIAGVLRGGR